MFLNSLCSMNGNLSLSSSNRRYVQQKSSFLLFKVIIVYLIQFYVPTERYSFFMISLCLMCWSMLYSIFSKSSAILHALIPQQTKMYLQSKDYSLPDLWKWSEWLEWDIFITQNTIRQILCIQFSFRVIHQIQSLMVTRNYLTICISISPSYSVILRIYVYLLIVKERILY